MARSFNGTSDSIQIGTSFSIGTAQPWSASAWINPTSVGGVFNVIVAKRTGGGVEFEMFTFGSGLGAYNGTVYSQFGSISTGVWTQCVVACDSSSFIAYLNGSSAGSDPASYVTGSFTASPVSIGAQGTSPTEFFPGSIAEVAVWNVKLDAAEAKALGAGYSPLFIRTASLQGYWPLIGRTSPEIELIGGFAGTLTGTSATPHPRIIMPRGRRDSWPTAIVYVYMRPDADQSDGGWLNELGTNIDLYASVDETVASDTDYIQSSTSSGDKVRLQLSDPGSGVAQPFGIRYRASATTGTASLFGRLYQGASTLIDSWNHTVNSTPTDYTHTLGSTEFALISDFNDLYIEFEYIP